MVNREVERSTEWARPRHCQRKGEEVDSVGHRSSRPNREVDRIDQTESLPTERVDRVGQAKSWLTDM